MKFLLPQPAPQAKKASPQTHEDLKESQRKIFVNLGALRGFVVQSSFLKEKMTNEQVSANLPLYSVSYQPVFGPERLNLSELDRNTANLYKRGITFKGALSMRFFGLFLVCLAFVTPASAQDLNTLLDIPAGQTLVNVSATERVEVDQDLLTASLQIEAKNASAKALQDEINTKMAKALEAAKKITSVKAATGSYYVYQYDPDPNTPRNALEWQGSQSLELKSKKADDLLALAGDLQDMGLSMQGLNYSISPDLLEETQNNLLESALAKLKTKADRTAKALGKTSADLLNINVDMGGGVAYAQPMMARAEMLADGASAKMAAPVAAPGQSDVTLTVSATALLK